jgi:enterochelin esterase family protein
MRITFVILFEFVIFLVQGQDYSLFRTRIKSFFEYGVLQDAAERTKKINDLWSSLQAAQQIPLVVEDSVAFLYRGNAKRVEWTGDFNEWGYHKDFANKGRLIPGTDIWILKASFPENARLDYKIVLEGRTQILDPENIHQQWSGVGGGSPNSELRMPNWREDPVLLKRDDIPHGTVKEEILFNSRTLGYQITYSVYLPAYSGTPGNLPSLYVTDGYEYMQPKLGNMITILDNLLADKKIKPIVVIFIDHREPINRSNNKRMDELAMNPRYLDFFTQEFIPFIESRYPVEPNSSTRAIMGSSMGGLSAAYFAFSRPGVFGMAGIQSPAFWLRPQIYAVCDSADHPIKVSMTSGLISDASEGSRKMKEILQANACQYHYLEVNDGHSWGNWRNLIDDVLIDLFGN